MVPTCNDTNHTVYIYHVPVEHYHFVGRHGSVSGSFVFRILKHINFIRDFYHLVTWFIQIDIALRITLTATANYRETTNAALDHVIATTSAYNKRFFTNQIAQMLTSKSLRIGTYMYMSVKIDPSDAKPMHIYIYYSSDVITRTVHVIL